jgi:hypothetical protein
MTKTAEERLAAEVGAKNEEIAGLWRQIVWLWRQIVWRLLEDLTASARVV